LFLAAPTTLTVMAVVSCITMLGAALCALVQSDLKRVLAWSTVSQLAYMVAALAVGARDAAVFHLLTHAFFKALLFLAAGAVIQAARTQRLADLGGLRRLMPVTSTTMGLALLSLAGIPVLSGFFSKESVFAAAERAVRGDAPVAPGVGLLVAVCAYLTVAVTGAYVARTWLMTFAGRYRGAGQPREAASLMRWPLVVLAVPTVALGFAGLSAHWLPTWTFPTATSIPGVFFGSSLTVAVQAEALRPQLGTSIFAVGVAVLGMAALASRWLRDRDTDPIELAAPWAKIMAGGFGVDRVYDRVAVRPFRAAVRGVTSFDRSSLEPLVRGTGGLAEDLGRRLQSFQDGNVQRYLSGALTGVAVAIVLVAVFVVSAVT